MKKNLMRGALAALMMILPASTGCVARSVIALDDHPDRAVSMMTVNSWNTVPGTGLVYKNAQEFWLCKEVGDSYKCTRTCKRMPLIYLGGDEIVCPAGAATIQVQDSNLGRASSASRPAATQPEPVEEPVEEPMEEPEEGDVAPN